VWLQAQARSASLAVLLFIPALFAPAFRSCVERAPIARVQTDPDWLSRHADVLWHDLARNLVREIQARRERVHAGLLAEQKRFKEGEVELPEDDEADMAVEGTYGQLPEVLVDTGHGAIFPVPISRPQRFSWFQVALQARHLVQLLTALEESLERWKGFPKAERVRRFGELGARWNQASAELNVVAREVRYLEAWVPQLTQQWLDDDAQGRVPPSRLLAQAILEAKPGLLAPLREVLRPRRVLKRTFLPEDLDEVPGGVVVIPVATDVSDRKFIAEVEGALSTHWNQSQWAVDRGVSFHIRWTTVAADKDFAAGRISLAQHLARFPVNKAAMTTGGLTTHVKGQALVLGPGTINPRTLAHELGHILGFDDCYFRTLSGQGVFGLAVLEWDNPLFPDDIMCDNVVGVPSAEAW
jgi:hypothetical protein